MNKRWQKMNKRSCFEDIRMKLLYMERQLFGF
jgi:hypothetical protein